MSYLGRDRSFPRVMVYDHLDNPVMELGEGEVFGLVRTDAVNGERSLEIATTAQLQKGMRVLMRDGTLKWREYVVMKLDQRHRDGENAIGTYLCMWSCKHDLSGVYVEDRRPKDATAEAALEAALSPTSRWRVGTVTLGTTASASFYWESSWDCIGDILEKWGGEVDATVEVDKSGIVSRSIDLYERMGLQAARRRFDFGEDLSEVRRRTDQQPLYCRIVPRGKGEETGGGGYGRRITIESVNGGKAYLEDAQAAQALRLPSAGGFEYPTLVVVNGDIDTPAALKAWGEEQLPLYTSPQVSYTASVAQYAEAGVDALGVSLGDAVDVVDPTFYPDGALRLSARVMKVVTDEMDRSRTKLTIANFSSDLADAITGMNDRLSKATKAIRGMNGGTLTTDDYLNNLIDRLNADINATGGYTYIVPGKGILTYDVEVSDPAVGAEASKVVEIKGGSMRIADSRTSGGDWNWRSVFTSGHIAADMVTAAQLTAGFIGSPSGNYWNLDTGELTMASTATFSDGSGGTKTAGQMMADTAAASTAASEASTAAAESLTEAKKGAGATNLLMDTNTRSVAKQAAAADRKWCGNASASNSIKALSATERPAGGIEYGMEMAFAANKRGKFSGLCFYDGKAVKLVDGQAYTFSCWAKRTGGTAGVKFQWSQTSSKASAWQELTTGWRRYSHTFTFKQSDIGGTDGARCYFLARSLSDSATTVRICGMKLELGEKATDWSIAPEDVKFGVTNAEALARAYTDKITALDRAYTDEQRAAIDASFDQAKIFNRLTKNGRAQGLFVKDGQLYVNGSYITTGTLDAGILKAGILMDKAQKSQWNLKTGYFKTKNAELENCNVAGYLQTSNGGDAKAQFNNGDVRFYHGKTSTMTLNGSLKFADGKFGSHLTFPGHFVMRGPSLAVDPRTTGNGVVGANFALSICIPTAPGSFAKSSAKWPKAFDPNVRPGTWRPESPTFKWLQLRFVNGICVTADLS